jgi:hypothetical protein
MILYDKKKVSKLEIELQEIEVDRATGIGVHVCIKRKHFNTKFFNLWIEKGNLSRFVRKLKGLVTGKVSMAELNSPVDDDFYLVLVRKDRSFFIGVQIKGYNFTPTKLKDFVSISFEIDLESIPPFIEELEQIITKF